MLFVVGGDECFVLSDPSLYPTTEHFPESKSHLPSGWRLGGKNKEAGVDHSLIVIYNHYHY